MFSFFKRNTKKRLSAVFHKVYFKTNKWEAGETGCGPGSTLENTNKIRQEIPLLLKSIHATSLLDAPCGDLNWISHIQFYDIDYIGVDIIEEIIKQNEKKFPGKKFMIADITSDSLPKADIVLCRDCFIHLPNKLIIATIANFKKAGIQYMLTNTYNFVRVNKDIKAGDFRMINLLLPPFSLHDPILSIEEEYTSGYPDKQLSLWKL